MMPAARLRLIPLALLVLMAISVAEVNAQEEKHKLTLDRNRVVGDRAKIVLSIDEAETTTQKLNGQAVERIENKTTGTMTAVIEILALHDNKDVKKVTLQIEAFDSEVNGKAVELDARQKIILSQSGDDTEVTYEDGKPLADEDAVTVLTKMSSAFLDDGEEGAKDDQVFNLEAARHVGESWEANHKLMAKDMSADGRLKIAPDDITSKVQFEKIEVFGGEQYAGVAIAVKMTNLGIPALAGSGMKLVKSNGDIALSGLIPLDRASLAGQYKMTMQMSFTASIKIEQGTLTLDVVTSQSQSAEYTPVK